MVAAVLACVGATLCDPMELRFDATRGTDKFVAAELLKRDPVKASVIIGIFGLKLLEGVFGHGVIPSLAAMG